jgi:hypothetical protein
MSWRQEVPIFTADGIRTVQKQRSRFLDVLVSKKAGPSNENGVRTATKTLERAQQTRSLSKDALSRASGKPHATSNRKYSNLSSERLSAKPPSPPSTAKTTKKLTGTASVYARKMQLPFDAMAEAPRAPKRPSTSTPRPSNVGVAPSSPSYGLPRIETSVPARRSGASSGQKTSEARSIDSTWFFPVGSKVRHRHLGEGVVLPPVPPEKDAEIAVLVEFRNGEQRKFPVQTADLSPIVI